MSDLIEALQIFLKYGDPRNPTNCSHDELAIMEVQKDRMSLVDIKRVGELGFHWDDDEEYWLSFRYGSA